MSTPGILRLSAAKLAEQSEDFWHVDDHDHHPDHDNHDHDYGHQNLIIILSVSATAPAKGTKTWLKRNLTKFPISSDFFSFVMQVLLLYIDYQKYLIVHLKRTNCDEQCDQIFHFYDISKCISTIWWDSSLSNKSDHPFLTTFLTKGLMLPKRMLKQS